MTTNGQMISKNSVVRYLALGDSYTIGESVAEDQRWPVQLVNALRKRGYACLEPEIIATTGWRTDDLLKAISERNPPRNYDLVSLLIGVNNQYQGKSIFEYEKGFRELLDLAVAHAAGDKSKVFVLSIPDYAYTPFGKDKAGQISGEIDRFNNINREITEGRKIMYIDITDISRQGLKFPALIAADGLHPSGTMYALWVEQVLRVMGL